MRRSVVLASVCALLLAGVARADCQSVGCRLSLGVQRLDPRINPVLAAAIFSGVAAASATYQLQHLYERADPEGVVIFTDAAGRPRQALALVPIPGPVPAHSAWDERPGQ